LTNPTNSEDVKAAAERAHYRGVRACVARLHALALEMNDPHARAVLNSAALTLGTDKPPPVAPSAASRTESPKPGPSAEGVEAVARIIGEYTGLSDQTACVTEAAAAILALPALSVTQAETVEPCYECGSTERIGTACKPCNPELWAETVGEPVAWNRYDGKGRPVPNGTWLEIKQRDGKTRTDSHWSDITWSRSTRWPQEDVMFWRLTSPPVPPSPGPETGVEISEEMVERAARAIARAAERKSMPSGRSAMVFANNSEWSAQLDSRVNSSWREHLPSARACLTAALRPQTSSKGEV
jgi:hypothetical protein